MNSNFGNYCKRIVLMVVATLAAIAPVTMSAQTSGTGLDGYTRVLWQGTDSSIVIWKLDGNFNVVSTTHGGPFTGWIPIGLTVGTDNYTRVIWRSTEGQLAVWLIDPNLNYVSGYWYGPYLGWLPESTSVDPGGDEYVIWRHTLGYMAVWMLSPDQSELLRSIGYTNSGYTPAQEATGFDRSSTVPRTTLVPGHVGERATPLPKEMTPSFER